MPGDLLKKSGHTATRGHDARGPRRQHRLPNRGLRDLSIHHPCFNFQNCLHLCELRTVLPGSAVPCQAKRSKKAALVLLLQLETYSVLYAHSRTQRAERSGEFIPVAAYGTARAQLASSPLTRCAARTARPETPSTARALRRCCATCSRARPEAARRPTRAAHDDGFPVLSRADALTRALQGPDAVPVRWSRPEAGTRQRERRLSPCLSWTLRLSAPDPARPLRRCHGRACPLDLVLAFEVQRQIR